MSETAVGAPAWGGEEEGRQTEVPRRLLTPRGRRIIPGVSDPQNGSGGALAFSVAMLRGVEFGG